MDLTEPVMGRALFHSEGLSPWGSALHGHSAGKNALKTRRIRWLFHGISVDFMGSNGISVFTCDSMRFERENNLIQGISWLSW